MIKKPLGPINKNALALAIMVPGSIFKDYWEKGKTNPGVHLILSVSARRLFIGEGALPFEECHILRFDNQRSLMEIRDFFQEKKGCVTLVLVEKKLPWVANIFLKGCQNLGQFFSLSTRSISYRGDLENYGGINPTSDQIEELKNNPIEGKVYMINLLSFKGREGKKNYEKYGQVALRSVALLGGQLAFIGKVERDDPWDQVAIVEYPSTKLFLNLPAMPGYAESTFYRTKGLEKTVLVISEREEIT
ncbi:hypothetical protein OAK75_08075 [Bacteriovoracales bacterium]|nr:hypothetical protein [Bacteriovoracales bacterium]